MGVAFIAFAAVCEIPLLVARRLFPQTADILPLGGDDFTQLAILVLMGVFLQLTAEAVLGLRKNLAKAKRQKQKNENN
jgi:hypothetical protein